MTDKKILDDLKTLCDYAYEMGFHEMGYDPVDEITDRLTCLKCPKFTFHVDLEPENDKIDVSEKRMEIVLYGYVMMVHVH